MTAPVAYMVHDYNEGRQEAGLKEFTVGDIYKEFVTQLTSRQLRLQFFETVYLPAVAESGEGAESSKASLLRRFNEILKVRQPSAKDAPSTWQVQVQLSDPELAASWANQYVVMAEQNTKRIVRKNIESELEVRINSVRAQVMSAREKAKAEREDEIVRLREALQIAETVGLSALPQPEGKAVREVADYVDRNQLYLRGSKALSAQLVTLGARTNDDPFIPDLRDMLAQAGLLGSLKVNDEKTFVVLIDEQAEIPEQAVKPQKKMIVAVGIVLGGMLGVFTALIRSMIRKRTSATSAA